MINKKRRKAPKKLITQLDAIPDTAEITGVFGGKDIKESVTKLAKLNGGIEVRNRKVKGKVYKLCFLGSDAVTWFQQLYPSWSREVALEFCQKLLDLQIICSVKNDLKFCDDSRELYQFMNIPLYKKTKILTREREKIIALHDVHEVVKLAKDPHKGFRIESYQGTFKIYPKCFAGNEAVSWLVENLDLRNRAEGIVWGQHLQDSGYIDHVTSDKGFRDKYLFYRWTDSNIGTISKNRTGGSPTHLFAAFAAGFSESVEDEEESESDIDDETDLLLAIDWTDDVGHRIQCGRPQPMTSIMKLTSNDHTDLTNPTSSSLNISEISSVNSLKPDGSLNFRKLAHNSQLGSPKPVLLDQGYVLEQRSMKSFVVANQLDGSEKIINTESEFQTLYTNFPKIYTLHDLKLLCVYDIITAQTTKYSLVTSLDANSIISDGTNFILVTEKKFHIWNSFWKTSSFVEYDCTGFAGQISEEFSVFKWPYLLLASYLGFQLWDVHFGEVMAQNFVSDENTFYTVFALHQGNLFVSRGNKFLMWLSPMKRLPLSATRHYMHQTPNVTAISVFKLSHAVKSPTTPTISTTNTTTTTSTTTNSVIDAPIFPTVASTTNPTPASNSSILTNSDSLKSEYVVITGDVQGILTARSYIDGSRLFSVVPSRDARRISIRNVRRKAKRSAITQITTHEEVIIIGDETGDITIWYIHDPSERRFHFVWEFTALGPVTKLKVSSGHLYIWCQQDIFSEVPSVAVVPVSVIQNKLKDLKKQLKEDINRAFLRQKLTPPPPLQLSVTMQELPRQIRNPSTTTTNSTNTSSEQDERASSGSTSRTISRQSSFTSSDSDSLSTSITSTTTTITCTTNSTTTTSTTNSFISSPKSPSQKIKSTTQPLAANSPRANRTNRIPGKGSHGTSGIPNDGLNVGLVEEDFNEEEEMDDSFGRKKDGNSSSGGILPTPTKQTTTTWSSATPLSSTFSSTQSLSTTPPTLPIKSGIPDFSSETNNTQTISSPIPIQHRPVSRTPRSVVTSTTISASPNNSTENSTDGSSPTNSPGISQFDPSRLPSLPATPARGSVVISPRPVSRAPRGDSPSTIDS